MICAQPAGLATIVMCTDLWQKGMLAVCLYAPKAFPFHGLADQDPSTLQFELDPFTLGYDETDEIESTQMYMIASSPPHAPYLLTWPCKKRCTGTCILLVSSASRPNNLIFRSYVSYTQGLGNEHQKKHFRATARYLDMGGYGVRS